MARKEHTILNTADVKRWLGSLGRRVRKLRKSNGYSLDTLAKMVGCSIQTIHGIEKGSGLSIAVYIRLSKVLNNGKGLMCR